MTSFQTKISDAASPLLILFTFALPLSTSAGSILAVLLLLSWFLSGNIQQKLQEILRNPVAIAVLLFLALHIIGLLWSDDIGLGLKILKKQWKLLLFPVLLSVVKKEHVKYYLSAFVLAITLVSCKAYLVLFGVIILPPSSVFITEGTSHVRFSPMLALSCYILLQNLLFNSNRTSTRLIQTALLVFLSVTMFITVGRTGQIAFFILLVVILFQYFYRISKIKLITGLILVPVLISATYLFSPTFKARADQALEEMRNHKSCAITSVGLRVWFAQNSLQLFQENIIKGVGTGDFSAEYAKVNQVNSPILPTTDNPHNQYILIAAQFGIIGIITLLSIFFCQIFISLKVKDRLTPLRQAFPIFFLVIMLGETYFQIHVTGLLFSLFSAFLYKDFYQQTSTA